MSHFKPHRRNPNKYKHDRVGRQAMKKFLSILAECHPKLKWDGSRTLDVLRLKAEIGGLTVALAHLVTKSHKDYKSSVVTGFYTGEQKEGYHLRISDRWKSFGRDMIVDDWFDQDSIFFVEISNIFKEISKTIVFRDTKESPLNRLGPYQSLKEVGLIISKM